MLALTSLSACGGKHASAYKCGFDTPTGYVNVAGVSSFSGISSLRQIGSTNMRIDWSHSTGSLGYLVVDASNTKPRNLTLLPAPVNTYTVTNLTPGANYAFKVQAVQPDCNVLDPIPGRNVTVATWSNTYSLFTDAVSSYMAAPTLQAALGTSTINKFSISLWHKTANAVPAQYSGIYGSVSNAAWNDGFGMYWEAAGVVRFFMNSYNTHYVEFLVPMPDAWNHYVVTYDSSLANNNLKLYVNGAVRSQHTYNANLVISSATSLDFGRLQANATRVSGNFDEAAIWSSALSATEITTIYNSGHPIDLTQNSGNYTSSSTLNAYWMMGDRASFPTIYNDVVNSADGTVWNGLATDIVADVP